MRQQREQTASVKSAARVMRILEYLAEERQATLTQIAQALDLPYSSAHELLATMASHGFVELEADGRSYRLGLRVWEIGRAYTADQDLVSLALPLLRRVTVETGETAQLARLDGLEVVYLAISESPQPMKLVSAVGKRLWAHGTALGKALLAALPEDELRARLHGVSLPRLTRHTIVHHDELIAELERTRVRGYSIDDEEYVMGCRCLAMAIRNADGEAVAAMSVSIPTVRYDAEVERAALDSLRRHVGELSARLGYRPSHRRPKEGNDRHSHPAPTAAVADAPRRPLAEVGEGT